MQRGRSASSRARAWESGRCTRVDLRKAQPFETGILFEVEGRLAGRLGLFLDPSTRRSLVRLLLDEEEPEAPPDRVESALCELANIVASQTVSAIADALGGSISLSVPRLALEQAGAAFVVAGAARTRWVGRDCSSPANSQRPVWICACSSSSLPALSWSDRAAIPCEAGGAVNRERLLELLEGVQRGEVEPRAALESLARLPFVDLPGARVDTHRALRHGLPEVVYAPGKTTAQIAEIVRTLREAEQDVLVTRIEPDVGCAAAPRTRGRRVRSGRPPLLARAGAGRDSGQGHDRRGVRGHGGSSGRRRGGRRRARFGNKVEALYDVGVAGLHRLLARATLLREARVLIVVAGMEGALPSVVGGLVDKPVIAVPTSVGYGAAFGGIAALLGMLTSCASNVTVVNIDNGFGAAYVATLINRL